MFYEPDKIFAIGTLIIKYFQNYSMSSVHLCNRIYSVLPLINVHMAENLLYLPLFMFGTIAAIICGLWLTCVLNKKILEKKVKLNIRFSLRNS